MKGLLLPVYLLVAAIALHSAEAQCKSGQSTCTVARCEQIYGTVVSHEINIYVRDRFKTVGLFQSRQPSYKLAGPF